MFGRLFEIVPVAETDGSAETPAPAFRLPPRPDFQGLEFLVGGVWLATPMPGTTYSEAIQWTLDGQYMTSTQISSTPPAAASLSNGFLGVDAAKQLIVMWGFSNNGTAVNLVQVKPSNPNTWVLQGLVRGLLTRQTMIKQGPDAMQTITETLAGGKWQATPPVSYQRAP
jgi:hypothetical protein